MSDSRWRTILGRGAMAGSMAGLGLIPEPADGTVIHVDGPLVVPIDSVRDVFWDVDGDTFTDFRLRAWSYTSATFSDDRTNVAIRSHNFNRNRAVSAGLPPGFAVGPTLAAYTWTNVLTLATGYGSRNVFFLADNFESDAGTHEGFVGLEFGILGGDTYGWARIRVDLAQPDRSLTVLEWAYEDEPGVPITIPAAASEPGASGLALLAMGAAGLAEWRRRRERASEPESGESG